MAKDSQNHHRNSQAVGAHTVTYLIFGARDDDREHAVAQDIMADGRCKSGNSRQNGHPV